MNITSINPFDVVSGKVVINKWGIFYAKFGSDIVLNEIGWPSGIFHREDGPAMVWFDGTCVWVCDGKRHREDGPAIVGPMGDARWFLYGVEYTAEQFVEELICLKK